MKDKETDGIIQYNNELFIFHGTVKKKVIENYGWRREKGKEGSEAEV